MGAPGLAVFCSNGHICQQTVHHQIPSYEPKKCWCGSTDLYTQFEWGDPDYPQFVPTRWLYYAWRKSSKTQKFIKFYVYDISKLIEHLKEKNN